MILPASRLTSYKSTNRKLALNDDTDDTTEEDEDDNNDSDSDEESNKDDNKDDDADDADIDMEVDRNTWEEVLRRIWCVISPPTEEVEIAGKGLPTVF